MSIATEVAVQELKSRVAVLEATNQALLTRVGDLESELEAVRQLADNFQLSSVPRGTEDKLNGAAKKR